MMATEWLSHTSVKSRSLDEMILLDQYARLSTLKLAAMSPPRAGTGPLTAEHQGVRNLYQRYGLVWLAPWRGPLVRPGAATASSAGFV